MYIIKCNIQSYPLLAAHLVQPRQNTKIFVKYTFVKTEKLCYLPRDSWKVTGKQEERGEDTQEMPRARIIKCAPLGYDCSLCGNHTLLSEPPAHPVKRHC